MFSYLLLDILFLELLTLSNEDDLWIAIAMN